MNSVKGSQRPSRLNAQAMGLWALLVALAAFVVFAALREAHKALPVPDTPAAAHAFSNVRPARSAADERFSQALWDIHADVRTAAVRMTFAGLAYKMGDIDRAEVDARVAPLAEVFRRAETALSALETPDSIEETRRRYANALRLYGQATQEMIKVARDGDDAHLLKAQEMSEQASGILLEVGDQLWPGEIKPN